MEMMRKHRAWAFFAAALVVASTIYMVRSIAADEPAPTPPASDPVPTRPPPIASGPHGDGPSYNIPRVEGRVASMVNHPGYGSIICEQDADVYVSMDGRIADVRQQHKSVRAPVESGEYVEGFLEAIALRLEHPWINPEGATSILDIPRYEKYREDGTLPGSVYRDEDGVLHWGCETWSPGGVDLPSVEGWYREIIEQLEATGCENPFCR